MGMAAPVLRFAMNDASLKRKIAELAADSSHVAILPHARKRMRERRILLTQVLHCLCHGNVVEPAHQDIKGCWNARWRHLSPETWCGLPLRSTETSRESWSS